MKELPPAKVAQTLRGNIGQVYLVKHRVSGLFKKAPEDARARME